MCWHLGHFDCPAQMLIILVSIAQTNKLALKGALKLKEWLEMAMDESGIQGNGAFVS